MLVPLTLQTLGGPLRKNVRRVGLMFVTVSIKGTSCHRSCTLNFLKMSRASIPWFQILPSMAPHALLGIKSLVHLGHISVLLAQTGQVPILIGASCLGASLTSGALQGFQVWFLMVLWLTTAMTPVVTLQTATMTFPVTSAVPMTPMEPRATRYTRDITASVFCMGRICLQMCIPFTHWESLASMQTWHASAFMAPHALHGTKCLAPHGLPTVREMQTGVAANSIFASCLFAMWLRHVTAGCQAAYFKVPRLRHTTATTRVSRHQTVKPCLLMMLVPLTLQTLGGPLRKNVQRVGLMFVTVSIKGTSCHRSCTLNFLKMSRASIPWFQILPSMAPHALLGIKSLVHLGHISVLLAQTGQVPILTGASCLGASLTSGALQGFQVWFLMVLWLTTAMTPVVTLQTATMTFPVTSAVPMTPMEPRATRYTRDITASVFCMGRICLQMCIPFTHWESLASMQTWHTSAFMAPHALHGTKCLAPHGLPTVREMQTGVAANSIFASCLFAMWLRHVTAGCQAAYFKVPRLRHTTATTRVSRHQTVKPCLLMMLVPLTLQTLGGPLRKNVQRVGLMFVTVSIKGTSCHRSCTLNFLKMSRASIPWFQILPSMAPHALLGIKSLVHLGHISVLLAQTGQVPILIGASCLGASLTSGALQGFQVWFLMVLWLTTAMTPVVTLQTATMTFPVTSAVPMTPMEPRATRYTRDTTASVFCMGRICLQMCIPFTHWESLASMQTWHTSAFMAPHALHGTKCLAPHGLPTVREMQTGVAANSIFASCLFAMWAQSAPGRFQPGFGMVLRVAQQWIALWPGWLLILATTRACRRRTAIPGHLMQLAPLTGSIQAGVRSRGVHTAGRMCANAHIRDACCLPIFTWTFHSTFLGNTSTCQISRLGCRNIVFFDQACCELLASIIRNYYRLLCLSLYIFVSCCVVFSPCFSFAFRPPICVASLWVFGAWPLMIHAEAAYGTSCAAWDQVQRQQMEWFNVFPLVWIATI